MKSLLDLFHCSGLAADGYAQAGIAVVGVDIDDHHSPHEVILADAVEVLSSPTWRGFVENFDFIHASPPCQAHTRAQHLRKAQGGTSKFPDLLTPTLQALRDNWYHKPWIVENVVGAPGMEGAVTLCGSMFGLQVQRHRLFKSNIQLAMVDHYGWPLRCDHKSFPIHPTTGKPSPWGVYYNPGDQIPRGGRTCLNAEHAMECMGIKRPYLMKWDDIKEGLPPSYTEYLGQQLLAY